MFLSKKKSSQLLLPLVVFSPVSGFSQSAEEGARPVEEVVVSATRSVRNASSLPIKVNVFNEDELRQQQTLATNTTEMLSNLIPSYSPGRQKLTSSGESFRGRRPLFLIDGVPQSNPLRDSRRDGVTIDPEMIERMEVVFGANAIQGLGATGGIINYVTASPPRSGALEQQFSVTTTSNDDFDDDGFGTRAHYRAGKRFGAFDVLGAVSYEQRGLLFDADDRPVGIDNVQGDVADSKAINFSGKFGWEPDDNQRLQLFASDFELEQDGDFVSVPGDRGRGIPATSEPGGPEGIEPVNDVTTLSLDYSHRALLGGRFTAQVYYQDFSALFGGGRFGTFQDPAIAPIGELFDQSENNSEKVGTRLTYSRADLAGTGVGLTAGLDYLEDKTFQRLALTNRNWVPETTFINYAPFAQFDVDFTDWLSLSSGIRWELAELDVPGFTTLAGNRSDFQPVQVGGGRPSFDEPLFNIGAVVHPVETLRLYATFSEAFSMPDVGRVLRGVGTSGTAVEDFLDLEPVVTDNLEFGAAYETGRFQAQLAWFESESDFGSRLQPNADGIFLVRRQATETDGWELSSAVQANDWLRIGVGYAALDGRFDSDGNGALDSDLGAADIGPDRINLTVDILPDGPWSARIQAFNFRDEAFRNSAGAETARFDGYTTVDASLSTRLGNLDLVFSASNLFDRQYITYFGQAGTNRDDRFFAGRGRTLAVRLSSRF